jgi:hypothetical protein
MSFKIDFNWASILRKVRIAFLLGVFYCLYKYINPVFGFMWMAYFLLNDLTDIESAQEESKEERVNAWKSISMKRKDF